jgi:hypothetical protein
VSCVHLIQNDPNTFYLVQFCQNLSIPGNLYHFNFSVADSTPKKIQITYRLLHCMHFSLPNIINYHNVHLIANRSNFYTYSKCYGNLQVDYHSHLLSYCMQNVAILKLIYASIQVINIFLLFVSGLLILSFQIFPFCF